MIDSFVPQKAFQTKEEYIYESLREAILHCKIQPGEKLVIDHLASTYGVSTIPIRTVLQRLQIEGLVEIIPHTGAQVAGISLSTVEEIFAILGAFESIAYPTAAQRITKTEIHELERLLDSMEKAVTDQDANQWSELNRKFHIRIAEISGMGLLTDFTKRIFDQWERIRIFYLNNVLSQRLHQAQQEHREILQLLREQDQAGLVAHAVSHNQSAKESYQNWINSHVKDPE
jgi:DNA-binding GntR family transcriptional regulator